MRETITDDHTLLETAALVDGHPTCACGQELDVCHHDHCLRCGQRLEPRTRRREPRGDQLLARATR